MKKKRTFLVIITMYSFPGRILFKFNHRQVVVERILFKFYHRQVVVERIQFFCNQEQNFSREDSSRDRKGDQISRVLPNTLLPRIASRKGESKMKNVRHNSFFLENEEKSCKFEKSMDNLESWKK